jgi:hypothetical protein
MVYGMDSVPVEREQENAVIVCEVFPPVVVCE